jgi:hypothetical protein
VSLSYHLLCNEIAHLLRISGFTRLIPALYDVVVFSSQYSTPFPFTRERYERYGKEVHHLLVGLDVIIPYLSLFPNITDLAIWTQHDKSLTGILEELPLTRLSVSLDDLDHLAPSSIQTFSSITHLEIGGPLNAARGRLHLLEHFTSLTHLSVLWQSYDAVLKKILAHRLSLKVLILWDGTIDFNPSTVRQ